MTSDTLIDMTSDKRTYDYFLGKKHTQESIELMKIKQKQKWERLKSDPEKLNAFKEKIRKTSTGRTLPLGEKHHAWKGGRRIEKRDGYVLVTAPEGHPYARKGGGGTRTRVILEHRLVMEKILGRYLLPDEDVNHINGIKHDNRPENLTVVRHYAHYQEMCCPKCEFKFITR